VKTVAGRVGWVLLLALAPFVAALWAGGTTIPGGNFEPWTPAMLDLDVYRRTGELVLHGQDFYNVEAGNPGWADEFTANEAHFSDTPAAPSSGRDSDP